MKNLNILLVSMALALSACSPDSAHNDAPQASAENPGISEGDFNRAMSEIDAEELLANTTVLASDEFRGRAPMSEGEKLTIEYMENAFRKAGLDPLFGDSYLQGVNLVSIDADPGSASMTFETNDQIDILSYGDDMVMWTTQVVDEVEVDSSEMVFVGYGIVAPEYGWNDYAGLDVEGKTVVILVNDPGYATKNPDLFNGNAMTYYGRWTYKYEEAARQGAAGAIVIHETAPASYGWNVVSSSWTGPQFQLATDNDNDHRVKIEAWMQREVAESLLAHSNLNLDDLKQQALSNEFKPVPLATVMNARLRNNYIKAQSYNVGAVLPGSNNPDEVFIYTAHWDHIGTGVSDDPDEDVIYNGAVDNASGTAGLVELAQAFAALPRAPERSVAFLAVTAEESGLLGSAWYAENPAFPMHKTVGGINMDSMHVYGPTKDVVVVGYNSSEMEDILREAAARQDRVVEAEEHPERGGYYRSDHFNFAKKGVPMLYAESGSDHRKFGTAYIEQKGREFVRNRYHAPGDEVLDDWDLSGAIEDLQLYFMIGVDVPDSNQWPNWYEGNEFKAIRDQSRAHARILKP